MVSLKAVVAITPNGGMGMNGTLPWVAAGLHLPKDMAYFKHHTSSVLDKTKVNAIIMGRRTWEGIPVDRRPLSNRLNIVLTQNDQWAKDNLPDNVLHASSLQQSIDMILNDEKYHNIIENAVVIGGASLFEETCFHPLCNEFHLTKLQKEFDSDVYLSSRVIKYLDELKPSYESDMITDNEHLYKIYVYNPSIKE